MAKVPTWVAAPTSASHRAGAVRRQLLRGGPGAAAAPAALASAAEVAGRLLLSVPGGSDPFPSGLRLGVSAWKGSSGPNPTKCPVLFHTMRYWRTLCWSQLVIRCLLLLMLTWLWVLMPFCAVRFTTFHGVAFKKHSHFVSVVSLNMNNADEMR